MSTNDEPFEPDIVDLQSWLVTKHAAFYATTKYLSAPYQLWLAYWKAQGRPQIDMPAQS